MSPLPTKSQTFEQAIDATPSDTEMQGATDSESIIQSGGRIIEALGNDLEAASTGALRDVDIDAARLRLRDCQSALAGMGYVVSDSDDAAQGIDGVSSRILKESVLQFQDDNDLELTGCIDRETYENIMRAFEQAMNMQAHSEAEDEFSFMHANQAISGGELQEDDTVAAEAIDDSDQALIGLQDDIDAGIEPVELEDL